MMVYDPLDDKLPDLAYFDFLHDVAVDIDVFRVVAVVIFQRVESVQGKEIVEAGRVDLIFPLAVLGQPFHPEPRRQRVGHEVFEVFLLRAQRHPVAQILAAVSAVVLVF